MKIEILSIQNLNSLSGKSEIFFNREPFNGSGLFAITGPTGAGKSTIFDAICLALYGRTPRLKNPDDIMSRHSAECYTELTFSVSGRKFRSRWEQRRSRGKADGKLQSAKMFVIDLNEDEEIILEDKKSSVPSVIAAITGLDYDQFTRSILLAQGNFASFLKAGINERADLLEKMTGSEIYTKLSIEAFNRSKIENEKLDRLKEKLGDTELISIEVLSEYQNELERSHNRRGKIRNEINSLTETENWLKQDIILNHRLDSCKYNFEDSQKTEQNSRSLKKEWEQIQKIVENLPVFETSIQLKNDIDKKTKEKQNLLKLVETIKNEVHKQTLLVDEKSVNLEKSYIEINRIQKLIEDTQVLDDRLNSSEILYKKNQNEEQENTKKLSDLYDNINHLERDLINGDKKTVALQEYLNRNISYSRINEILPLLIDKLNRYSFLEKELNMKTLKPAKILQSLKNKLDDDKNSITELEKMIYLLKEDKSDNRESLEKVKEVLLKLSPIAKSWKELIFNNNNYAKDKISYIDKLEKVSDELKKISKNLEKEKDLYNKKTLMEHAYLIQQNLNDGETCPVCNNTYHNHKINNHTQQLRENEKVIETLTLSKQDHINHKQRLEDQILNINKLISENEKKLLHLKNEWNEIKGNEFEDLAPDDREKANLIYKENEKKLTNCIKIDSQYHELINKERRIKDSYEANRKEYEKILSSVQIKNEFNEIGDNLNSLLKPFHMEVSNKGLLEILDNYKKAYELKKEELDAVLNGQNINRNKLEIEENLKKQLTVLDLTLKEQLKQTTEIILDLKKTISEKTDNKSVSDLKIIIKNLRENNDRELSEAKELLSSKRENLSQCNGKLEILGSELPQLELQYEKLNAQLQNTLKKEQLSIADFQIPDLRLKSDSLKREIDSIREKRIRAEESFKSVTLEIEQHRQQQKSSKTIDEISVEIQSLKSEIENLSRNIGIIEEKLQSDENKREQVQELALSITGQESDCLKWSKIKNLIGSADGKTYKRFVQGLTLEKLVQLSNIHLTKLNNRYKIERSDSKELEIEIVDCWQADTIRPSSTLSGGESFLVSLALSLGLSELVGNKVVIDSLFLDEGFGTLDPDTLETVLSALETLQSSGKLIGIISHVEAIRERISVQIKVRKLAGGRSVIDIV